MRCTKHAEEFGRRCDRRLPPPQRLAEAPTAVPAAAPAAVGAVAVARNGQPTDVLLQGFHWNSHSSQNPNWYQILQQNAGVIKGGKFDLVWGGGGGGVSAAFGIG